MFFSSWDFFKKMQGWFFDWKWKWLILDIEHFSHWILGWILGWFFDWILKRKNGNRQGLGGFCLECGGWKTTRKKGKVWWLDGHTAKFYKHVINTHVWKIEFVWKYVHVFPKLECQLWLKKKSKAQVKGKHPTWLPTTDQKKLKTQAKTQHQTWLPTMDPKIEGPSKRETLNLSAAHGPCFFKAKGKGNTKFDCHSWTKQFWKPK